MTKAQAKKIKELLPLVKAIRERCLDCSAGSSYEVEKCPCLDCALYSCRMGLKSRDENFTREKTPKTAENDTQGTSADLSRGVKDDK